MKFILFKVLLVTLCMSCFIFSSIIEASFEQRGIGARAVAMGGAYTAIADDNYAQIYNPAGLPQNKVKQSISLTHFKLYNQGDFSTFYVSYIYPDTGFGGFGISEHFFGSFGYYYENISSLSYGMPIIGIQNIFVLNIGLSLHYLYKSFRDEDKYTSVSGLGTDYSTLITSDEILFLKLYWVFKAGLIFRKKYVEDRRSELQPGLAMIIEEKYILSFDYNSFNKRTSLGCEIKLFDEFLALRTGFYTDKNDILAKCMGIGIYPEGIKIDYGVDMIDPLPKTHRISLGFLF